MVYIVDMLHCFCSRGCFVCLPITWQCVDKFPSTMCKAAAAFYPCHRIVCIIAVADQISVESFQKFGRMSARSGRLIIKDNDAVIILLAVGIYPHPRYTCWLSSFFMKHLNCRIIAVSYTAGLQFLCHCPDYRHTPFFGCNVHPV